MFRTRLIRWINASIARELEESELQARVKKLEEQMSHIPTHPLSATSNNAPLADGRECCSPAPAVIAKSSILASEGSIENLGGNPNLIRIGANCYIRGRLLTYGHAGRIKIGDWCYVGSRTEIWSMDSISIGDRVLISHNVNIIDGSSHSTDSKERHQHFRQILEVGHPTEPAMVPGIRSAPIVIEDDVWISFGVTILKGVTIGKGSVIAAGSMVTKDVPPNSLYRCDITPIVTTLTP